MNPNTEILYFNNEEFQTEEITELLFKEKKGVLIATCEKNNEAIIKLLIKVFNITEEMIITLNITKMSKSHIIRNIIEIELNDEGMSYIAKALTPISEEIDENASISNTFKEHFLQGNAILYLKDDKSDFEGDLLNTIIINSRLALEPEPIEDFNFEPESTKSKRSGRNKYRRNRYYE